MESTVSIHAYRRVQKENEELQKRYNALLEFVKSTGITYVEANEIKECSLVPRVNQETHQWELCLEDLVLEQQGGII
jgi:hypothetical protein